MRKLLRQASIAFFSLWIVQCAIAQNFPTKPVQFVVPFPPGGTADILMRILADPLSESWGKPVIVENRPGATTIIASEIVAHARADGYTLLVNSASFLINPSLRPKVPYDVFKDFAPVMLLVNSPLVVVNSSSAVKSLCALVDQARARQLFRRRSARRRNIASARSQSNQRSERRARRALCEGLSASKELLNVSGDRRLTDTLFEIRFG